MSMQLQAQVKPTSTSDFTPVRTGLLQIKCASDECAERRKKQLTLQRSSTNQSEPSEVPPIVHEVLHSPGQPLDSGTRAFMELRFGHDFGQVRIHTDETAAESAAIVNGLAYTVGRNVVFGAGQYRPQTNAGRLLLAHELVHVVQQAGAISLDNTISSSDDAYENEAESLGTDLLSEASTIAQPTGCVPGLQRQELTLTPPSLLKPPSRPGMHLLPSLEQRPQLRSEDRARIDSFLMLHGFSVGPGLRPSLDGGMTTLDSVVEAVRPLVLPIIARSDIESYVQARWSRMVHDALLNPIFTLPPLTVPNVFAPTPGAPPTPAAPTRPITLTAGVNYAWHVNLSGTSGTSKDRTLQLQFGEDVPLQRVFQVSYNLDSQQVQIVVGGQKTGDIELVKNLLKLSGFVQILAGVAWTGSPASGTFTIIQPSVGGQLTLMFGPVQFAVQAAFSATSTQGQPTTGEFNLTPQVTFRF